MNEELPVKRLIASLVLFGLSAPSFAARMALEPLNRAHFGASVILSLIHI